MGGRPGERALSRDRLGRHIIPLRMIEYFTQYAGSAPLVGAFLILGLLLLSGFGLPIPEDIPILVAGYLSAQSDIVDPWWMLPATFIAIVGSDGIVFFLGRKYGRHVPKVPLLGRMLTRRRLLKAERFLDEHGGKSIFLARFMPGLRTPAFFTAGTCRVPYWKFLFYDGAAALLSVPTIFLLAYFLSDQIYRVKEWVGDGQLAAAIVVACVVIGLFAFHWFAKRRKLAAAET